MGETKSTHWLLRSEMSFDFWKKWEKIFAGEARFVAGGTQQKCDTNAKQGKRCYGRSLTDDGGQTGEHSVTVRPLTSIVLSRERYSLEILRRSRDAT
jgi:hypothetical protein